MSSPAHELARYLDAQGVGVFASGTKWSINVSTVPVSPDETITLMDHGGSNPDTDELDIQKALVEVRVRSKSYLEAYDKQEEIRELLINPAPLVTGLYFIGLEMVGNINSAGRDANDRHILAANYEAELER